ncbi:MAG: hypothetical protein JEY96_19400 [Bacteroidales bacterium]|nr:hypothetical protein [Bacteroidales bacterium]
MRKLILLVGLTIIFTTSNSQTLIDKEVVLKWNDGNTTWITSDTYSHILTSGQVGSVYPFQTRGNLLLQPRAHAATDIVFGTGATPTVRMVVKGNGNVGIGTTSPDSKLDVEGEFRVTGSLGNLILQNSGAVLKFTRSSANYIEAGTGGFLVFNTNGTGTDAGNANLVLHRDKSYFQKHNVGIGTANPMYKLQVHGSVLFKDESSVNGFYFAGGTGANRYLNIYDDSGSSTIKLSPEGNSYFNGGNIGIGTADTKGYKLAVAGKVVAEEVVVALQADWADFVFNKDYKLKDLEEVENFIEENNHLPDVPSEKEVLENGIQLGEMDATLLQKIEELTLYMIDINKEVKALRNENLELKEKVKKL